MNILIFIHYNYLNTSYIQQSYIFTSIKNIGSPPQINLFYQYFVGKKQTPGKMDIYMELHFKYLYYKVMSF